MIQTTRDFAIQHIKPFFKIWDEAQEFSLEVFRKLGELGLMRVLMPEEYIGARLSYFEYNAAI